MVKKRNASTKLQHLVNTRWQPPKTTWPDFYAMAFLVGVIFSTMTW